MSEPTAEELPKPEEAPPASTHAATPNEDGTCDPLTQLSSGVVNSVSTVGTGVASVGEAVNVDAVSGGVTNIGSTVTGGVMTGVDAITGGVSSLWGSIVGAFSGSSSKKMIQRRLGSQGLVVSVQGLGCMGMTAFYHDSDPALLEEGNQATIAHALELGINFFDTAWIYQSFGKGGFPNHTNEELLGRAIAKHGRDKFIICTKCGILPTADGPSPNSTEAVIRSQLADSLQRLGVDVIDLYYQHRPDPNVPMEDVARLMKSFVEEGKIRYVGLSECTADELRRFHAIQPVTALQMEYSLQTRDIETNDILNTARELGVGIVAYSPLGRGLLTTKLVDLDQLDPNDWRRNNPRFAAENFEKNKQLEAFKAYAERKNCTPGQLALAWLYAQGDDIFPIPGTKSAERLNENAGAVNVKLTKEEADEIAAVVAPGVGGRYAPRKSEEK